MCIIHIVKQRLYVVNCMKGDECNETLHEVPPAGGAILVGYGV